MEKINNVLHKHSSKPLLYGTRDAIIVAFLTVLVLLIMYFIYYLATGNLATMKTAAFWESLGKSFLTSLILGYIYEYGGINARFSAESMRYAKGSTLDKFQKRNQAVVSEIASDKYRDEIDEILKKSRACIGDEAEEKFAHINKNIDRIRSMVKATRELKVIIRMLEEGKTSAEIYAEVQRKYSPTHVTEQDVENLINIESGDETSPAEERKLENLSRLKAVPRLVELFGVNPELIEYFIKEGFSKLAGVEVKSMNGWTVDVAKLREQTGIKVKEVGIGKGLPVTPGAGGIAAGIM
jgi:hypothetical protein